jgi:hypothetical protein
MDGPFPADFIAMMIFFALVKGSVEMLKALFDL